MDETAPYLVLREYETDLYGWLPGDIVWLPESVAEWVERDSPGVLQCLERAQAAVEVFAADLQSPPGDRMVRSSDTPPLRRSRRRLDRVGDPGDQGAMTRATFKAVRDSV
jgi:hypothetical protein